MSEQGVPVTVLVSALWIAAVTAFFGTVWLIPHVYSGGVEGRLIIGTAIGLVSLAVSLGIPLLYRRFKDRRDVSLPKL